MNDIIYILTKQDRNIHDEVFTSIAKVTTDKNIADKLSKLYGYRVECYRNCLDYTIINDTIKYYEVSVRLKNNEMIFNGNEKYGFKNDIDTKGQFGYWYQDAPKTIFDLHQTSYKVNVIADNEYDARDIAEKQYLADVKALGIDTKDLYYDA
jgi:hypothetical protein